MSIADLELLSSLISLQVTFFPQLPTSVVPGKLLPDRGIPPPAISQVRGINTSGFFSPKQSLAHNPN